jgi:hypothetical protein
MEKDRLLHILRYVAVPIVVAAITGYYETRVRMAKEQTKATYEALAPSVRDLQDEVAKLQGRVDELSKTTRVIVMRPEPAALAKPAAPAAKPSAPLGALGATGKVEVMVDHPAPPQSKRPAAKFDDMLKGL